MVRHRFETTFRQFGKNLDKMWSRSGHYLKNMLVLLHGHVLSQHADPWPVRWRALPVAAACCQHECGIRVNFREQLVCERRLTDTWLTSDQGYSPITGERRIKRITKLLLLLRTADERLMQREGTAQGPGRTRA